MPYGKRRFVPRRPRAKRTFKAKKYYKRKNAQLYRRRIQGIPSGMPNVRVAKLRYADTIQLVSTSGSIAYWTFRANSCHDPDYTSSGHQPMGWDIWSQLYNHYIVLGSKITVKAVEDGTSAGPSTYCGIIIGDSVTVPHSSASSYLEEGYKTRINVFQRKPLVYTQTYSAKKFFNLANIKDNISRLGATFGTNPTDDAYFHMWQQPVDSTSSNTMLYSVIIEYIVLFSEPKKGVVS